MEAEAITTEQIIEAFKTVSASYISRHVVIQFLTNNSPMSTNLNPRLDYIINTYIVSAMIRTFINLWLLRSGSWISEERLVTNHRTCVF